MRILYVTDGLGNGGKERQLIETVKHLNRELFEPGILTFNGNQSYTDTASKIAEYFEIIPKEKNKLDPLFSSFNTFEKFRPDIVHSFDVISALYTYLPSKLYGSKILNASIQDAGLDCGWQKKLKLKLIRRADKVIGNSRKGLEYYDSQGEALYNFIDESRFPEYSGRQGYRAVMVANFSRYKDYDSYFAVVENLLRENLIDEAYAVGAGINIDNYKSKICAFNPGIKGRIYFTGNSPEVERLLTGMYFGFLFSTEEYGEGISNSVLEYMSSGVISIVSDIGASNEIIEDGVNGFLVDKHDISRITEIVRRIKNDREYSEMIRRNAKATVREKFSLKRNLARLENIYLNLVSE